MTDFEKLARAQEAAFINDLDLQARVKARAYKYFGMWIAEKMGMVDRDAMMEYAMSLIVFELSPEHKGTALEKALNDLAEHGKVLDKYDAKDYMEDSFERAEREFFGEV